MPDIWAQLARRESAQATSRTQIFTPEPIATWLARAGLQGLVAPRPRSIIDIAAGSGRLLAAAANVLRQRGFEASVVRSSLHGIECDRSLVDIANDVLGFDAVQVGDGLSPKVEHADVALLNPPFGRADKWSEATHEALAHRFPFHRRQIEGAAFFVAESLMRLRPGGRLAAITPRYWLEATSARDFRRWLTSVADIEVVYDLGNHQVWPSASVLTVLLVARKRKRTAQTSQHDPPVVHRVHGRLYEPLAWPPAHATRALPRDGAPWWTGRQPRLNTTLRLGDIADVGQGLKSGRNAVFVMEPARAIELGIEAELLRPTVKTRNLRPHQLELPATGANQLLLVLADTDLAQYPGLAAWLSAHRSVLERRYQVRAGEARWSDLSLPQNLALMNRPKLLSPLYARRNIFVVDDVGYHVLTDVYVVAPRSSSPNLWALAAVLNSAPLCQWAANRAKLKRDGYLEFGSRLLRELPVPAHADGRLVEAPEAVLDTTPNHHWNGLSTEAVLTEAGRLLAERDDPLVSSFVDRVVEAALTAAEEHDRSQADDRQPENRRCR